MNKVKIGDLLTRVKEPIDIEEDKQYKRVTIKTNNQGVYLRDIEFGRNIGTKKQFIIHEGQFLLSKIDARNGAFGIVPNDLDGAIITGNFWAYEVNHELLNIEWFNIFVSSREFIDICDRASSGTTNRRYLDENKFLNFTISLPSFNEQSLFVENFKWIKQKFDFIMSELSYQYDLIIKLRQSILQEAVEGKLVPQDPNDEPASVLLEKIKEEKERLIKEGKIKKEKPLPPISEDEIPYELPEGWEWVRLGEVTNYAYNETLKPDEIDEEEWVLELEDIEKDTSRLIQVIRNKDRKSKSNKNRFYKGDVLYGKLRPYLKKVLVAPEDGVCSTEIIPFRGYGNIESRYIMYIMKSPYIDKIVNSITHGMNMPRLGTKNALELLIPLPPINEQKRIVEKVDQLMALCDELEKNIEQSKKDCELLIQSVLQEAFKEA
ncbi:hypothetical protein CSTERLE_13765 [Thermoclostridium stercorarium subsp. leptospartum DSM 9219]|uniref:Type I restriction modification DNA specificity domain-containing protein n=1 Tax=Thermoclostridium stercorarium subsp. leptospartum DSM 9219 TaxID=1346611 RepID=A0A1B1YP35_THEST|nr:restriction endonuclease subunit S [Thermoclostridium stercorarium]ANX02551.1 hypothetical protein CSTERLE_13765 [Thermoclostridium stercorarium subsp. leptospartum DSM 9219]